MISAYALRSRMPRHTCPTIDSAKQDARAALDDALDTIHSRLEDLRDDNVTLRDVASAALDELEAAEELIQELEHEVNMLRMRSAD